MPTLSGRPGAEGAQQIGLGKDFEAFFALAKGKPMEKILRQ